MRYFSRLSFILISIPLIACSCQNQAEADTSVEARLMQQFVEDISAYARGIKGDFIIIPQNGAELTFTETDLEQGILQPYIDAIDGIGIEELFYDGAFKPDNERLQLLRTLRDTVNPPDKIKILVSDFVSNNANLPDAINRSQKESFIAFPRASDNYDYMYIPALSGANTNDINTLNDAQNYLYLISTDNYYNENLPDEGKQAMIDAIAATDYDLIIIDLFFEDSMLSRDDVNQLKTKHNGKKRLVVSYISIGSAENYRYYWQKGWKKGAPSWLKKSYDGYPDEYWVEFWNPQWQEIIYGDDGFNGEDSYIKKIIDAGFDGAYLDNVEAYYFLKNN